MLGNVISKLYTKIPKSIVYSKFTLRLNMFPQIDFVIITFFFGGGGRQELVVRRLPPRPQKSPSPIRPTYFDKDVNVMW